MGDRSRLEMDPSCLNRTCLAKSRTQTYGLFVHRSITGDGDKGKRFNLECCEGAARVFMATMHSISGESDPSVLA
jgi:hypothetical protein